MKNFIFLCQQHLVSIISFFQQIPFTIRLKYLVWKYKGGENIPAHEMKGMLIEDKNGMLQNTILLISAINGVCNWLKLINMNTRVYVMVGLFIHNKLPEVELAEKVEVLLKSKFKRKAVYDLMIEEDDIKPSTVDYCLVGTDVLKFKQWLMEEEM